MIIPQSDKTAVCFKAQAGLVITGPAQPALAWLSPGDEQYRVRKGRKGCRLTPAGRTRTESYSSGGCSTAERHHTALEEEEDRRFDMGWMEELQSALEARGLAVASIPGKGRGLITTRDFAPGESPLLSRPSPVPVHLLVLDSSLINECSTKSLYPARPTLGS